MAKEPKVTRFEVVHDEGAVNWDMPRTIIFKDKQTGALYLFARSVYGGGLTPLLDADGKPVVDKSNE